MDLKCNMCRYVCKRNDQLKAHYKDCHPDVCNTISKSAGQKCPQNDCSLSFRAITDLVEHLESAHNYEMEKVDISFDSIEGEISYLKTN